MQVALLKPEVVKMHSPQSTTSTKKKRGNEAVSIKKKGWAQNGGEKKNRVKYHQLSRMK